MGYAIRHFLPVALVASCLSGCGGYPTDFMQEPSLSPVGAGLVTANQPVYGEATALVLDPGRGQHGSPPTVNLYTDQRVTKVGDIVTVIISINDKATFDNATDRSKTANSNFNTTWGYTQANSTSSGQPANLAATVTSTSNTQGQGNIDRQEQIQVSVAAVVTEVLPNGNLVISGSQEVRVNYELRDLTVAGIVHPDDISRNNTVAYDRIAEARISYGGRGRLTEVQQPSWGQEIYDFVKPF
jgi:flagellar L-ring protein FlgH